MKYSHGLEIRDIGSKLINKWAFLKDDSKTKKVGEVIVDEKTKDKLEQWLFQNYIIRTIYSLYYLFLLDLFIHYIIILLSKNH